MEKTARGVTYDRNEWIKAGFNKNDSTIEQWVDFGFTANEAIKWEKAALSPERSIIYYRAGLSANKAEKFSKYFAWWEAGFKFDEKLDNIREWQAAGIEPNDARSWSRYGFPLEEVQKWKAEQFKELSPYQAKLWKGENFKPHEASEWKRENYSPHEAAVWRKCGFKSTLAPSATVWRRKGIGAKEAKLWLENKFTAQEAEQWIKWGFACFDAIEWRQQFATSFDLQQMVLNAAKARELGINNSAEFIEWLEELKKNETKSSGQDANWRTIVNKKLNSLLNDKKQQLSLTGELTGEPVETIENLLKLKPIPPFPLNPILNQAQVDLIIAEGKGSQRQVIINYKDNDLRAVSGAFYREELAKKRTASLVFCDQENNFQVETVQNTQAKILEKDAHIRISVFCHGPWEEINEREIETERLSVKIQEFLKSSYGECDGQGVSVSLEACNNLDKLYCEDIQERLYWKIKAKLALIQEPNKKPLKMTSVTSRNCFMASNRGSYGVMVGQNQYSVSSPDDPNKLVWGYRTTNQKFITFYDEGCQELVTIEVPLSDEKIRIDKVVDPNQLALRWSEATFQTEKFLEVTTYLQKEHGFSENFRPDIKSLQATENDEGNIQLVNIDNKEEMREVKLKTNEFKELKEFKDYLHTQLSNTREVDSPHGLTAAFAVLAVVDFLSKDKVETNSVSSVKSWLNYSQLLLDTGHEIYKFADIVKTASKGLNSGLFGAKATIGISKVSGYGGAAFSLVFVGLDAVELFNAKTNFEKEIAETQLIADGSGLALGATSLAIGGTAGAFVGIVGVPVTGALLGIVTLLNLHAEDREKALRIADHFQQCESDYNSIEKASFDFNNYSLVSLGYSGMFVEKNKLNTSHQRLNNLIVEKIDLTNENEIRVGTNSDYIYRSSGQEEWNRTGVIWYNHNTGPDNKKENALSLKSFFKIDKDLFSIKPNKQDFEIILPSVAKSYLSCFHNTVPGIMSYTVKDDSRLSTVLKMQETGKFLFRFGDTLTPFFKWPTNDWAIRDLKFEYQASPIEVLLGNHDCVFIAPSVPLEYKDQLSYNFKNGNGKYVLALSVNNANCKIENSGPEARWIIDTGESTIETKNNDDQVHIIFNITFWYKDQNNKDKSKQSTVKIDIAKPYPRLLVRTKGLDQEFNFSNYKLKTTVIDEAILNQQKVENALLPEHFVDAYVEVDNHLIGNQLIKRAWYSRDKKRYFYLLLSDQDKLNYANDEYYLLGLVGESSYYFMATKKVVFYQDGFDNQAKIISTGIDHAFFAGKQVFAVSKESGVTLALEKEQKKLWRINTLTMLDYTTDIVNDLENLCQKNQWAVSKIIPFFSGERSARRWYVPNLKRVITLWQSNWEDFQLLGWKNVGSKIAYFFYNLREKKVYWLKQSANQIDVADLDEEVAIPEPVISLNTENNNIIAISENGCYFSIDEDGEYSLQAITDKWLVGKEGESIQEVLEKVVADYKPGKMVTMIGQGQVAYYDSEKKVAITSPKNKALVGYDDTEERVYSFQQTTQQISYHSVAENNATEYLVKKNGDSYWIENINGYREINLGLPISPVKASFTSDQNIVIIDSEGKLFIVWEDDQKKYWKVKLIALNNDWLIKNQSALKENLKVVTENANYQSEKVVSLNYANEKKGWYDQTSQTLIELKLPANNQEFSYLAVDCFNQKAYFLALNQPQLIQEGRDSNHPITVLKPTYFTDFKVFEETVAVKVASQPGINVNIPCFSGFSSILISGGREQKTFLISERNLNHYHTIKIDFLADNGVTNQINFNLPYRDFKLNWYGSDYILNYQGSQVLITGYQKEVKLIFNDHEESSITTVTVAHNKLGSESPNLIINQIVINQTSQLSQRTEMIDEADQIFQQEIIEQEFISAL